MKYRKITQKEFAERFKTKPFKGQWDCYGTWNCQDVYELADTEENARIAMWQSLVKWGWAYTAEEEHRIEVLKGYAALAKPQRTTPLNG